MGATFRQRFFDPPTLSNGDVILQVEGKENMVVQGKELTAYRVKESIKGMTLTTWITENGETVREESTLGFVLKKESREEALSREMRGKGADVIDMSAVPADRPIDKAHPSYLKVRLEGVALDGAGFKNGKVEGGRQRLKQDVLLIVREEMNGISSYRVPYRGDDLHAYLDPSLLIQSDDPDIKAQAREIMGDERSAVKVVELLLRWMEVNIEKKPTVSVPNAREVLQLKYGDCKEHAALFAAFARSLGISSKICGGIVYDRGSFFYHAWNEVFVGRWVSVDPLMKQFPADATHVRLVEGDLEDQLPLLAFLGRLRIKVMEYR